MKISFEKYHGAGNDFILIDNRNGSVHLTKDQIAALCNRHLGVGADGLILLATKENFDFEMIYYNADGGLGSMCGNGGRCAVIFARTLGLIHERTLFSAFDGAHKAIINEDGTVKLSMSSVHGITRNSNGDFVLNTGSPHLVRFVNEIKQIDVVSEGRHVRYSDEFKEKGINVNFTELGINGTSMRTYERGVEDETLSCGTGTVAVAMSIAAKQNVMNHQQYTIAAPGGKLNVYFNRINENNFEDVWLEGSVTFVFSGQTSV